MQRTVQHTGSAFGLPGVDQVRIQGDIRLGTGATPERQRPHPRQRDMTRHNVTDRLHQLDASRGNAIGLAQVLLKCQQWQLLTHLINEQRLAGSPRRRIIEQLLA
ncbi:hypothetical protein D9M71_742880 [compost metagenome]